MGMWINEAWRDDQIGGVDTARSMIGHLPHFDNTTILHGDIGAAPAPSATVPFLIKKS